MKFDFIREHKAFDIYCRTHVLSPYAQLLWYRLFMLANNAFYPDELLLSNCQAMSLSGTDDPRKLTKARKELISAGLLIYSPGKKSFPGSYILCSVAETMCAGAPSSMANRVNESNAATDADADETGNDTENAGEYVPENAGVYAEEYAGENGAENYKEYYYNIKQNKNKKQNNTHTKVKSGACVDNNSLSEINIAVRPDPDHGGTALCVNEGERRRDRVSGPADIVTDGKRGAGTPDMFEAFWENYPKKKGYEKAREAFLSADIDGETFGQIMSALNKAKDTVAWNLECGRYVPSPERYIREKRWNDVITDGELRTAEPAGDSFGDADEFLAAAIRKGMP